LIPSSTTRKSKRKIQKERRERRIRKWRKQKDKIVTFYFFSLYVIKVHNDVSMYYAEEGKKSCRPCEGSTKARESLTLTQCQSLRQWQRHE